MDSEGFDDCFSDFSSFHDSELPHELYNMDINEQNQHSIYFTQINDQYNDFDDDVEDDHSSKGTEDFSDTGNPHKNDHDCFSSIHHSDSNSQYTGLFLLILIF